MKIALSWLIPQPLTALVMSVLAAAGLAAAVVAAGRYPIHLQYRTKVLLTTVPIYLAATLLPPALAALSAGLGVLALQLLERQRKGSLPSDIATAMSRWVIVAALS